MANITYPNGQVLTSTALTPNAISLIIQTLTYGMIGLPIPLPNTWQPVQIDWQTQGQPMALDPSKDVCYVACVTEDVQYNRVRDLTKSGIGADNDPLTETWVYTRGWKVSWLLYGPNSTDRARAIHSAFFMDWVNDSLELSNLYPVSEFAEPTRTPELINAQWWERADFSVSMYEQVTETIIDNVVTSLEIKTYVGDPDLGLVADTTVEST
jgi:hypothetical protein